MINRGTIEGFFGREWSHSDRLAHIDFLASTEAQFYIYAPKSDAFLRKHWQQEWPLREWKELMSLASHCKEAGILFGIGLSPFELHLNFDESAQKQLQEKITRINQLNPDILCVLFDDMRGDKADLAQIQCNITKTITAISNAKQHIICPSYYSEDPVLDKVFGERPANYLRDLGQLLPAEIDIFWTGTRVCSSNFSDQDIERVSSKLRRRPFLWDNYPVNDGAKMCQHLHLKGFEQRSNLNEKNIAGHAINPMNQAWLSRIPLATLPGMYNATSDVNSATRDTIISLCPPALASHLLNDLDIFQNEGLGSMTEEQRDEITRKYESLSSSPYTREIIDWLTGCYQFDPNCLTA